MLGTRAYVDPSGAIVLGGPICVDGHAEGCSARVVTHIHADHVIDLEKSVRSAKLVVATPITHELLEEIGYSIPKTKRVCLDYGQSMQLENYELKLVYAHHIIGSSQVVVVARDEGVSYGYTGDFKHPGKATPILKVNTLVIDATYGKPSYKRPPEEVVISRFVDLVRSLLSRGPVEVYAYYGKIQEAMVLLRDWGIDAPFLVNSKNWRILKRLERYGIVVKDVFMNGTHEANEIKKQGWYVYFDHYTKFYEVQRRNRSSSRILLSGWLFREAVRSVDENTWIVALSDHADFNELLYYVDEARPDLLIVDAYRGGDAAYTFAEVVRQRLGLRAIAMP